MVLLEVIKDWQELTVCHLTWPERLAAFFHGKVIVSVKEATEPPRRRAVIRQIAAIAWEHGEEAAQNVLRRLEEGS